jgi:hypothetical protein
MDAQIVTRIVDLIEALVPQADQRDFWPFSMAG